MKKTLLTTTAIVAFASAASAEVTLSGSAELGFVGGSAYDDPTTPAVDEGKAQFMSNVDVKFTLSGETDNGLSFGASIDLDEATATKNSKEAVWVSGAFGRVTMGDTDGAMDWALTEAGNMGNPGSLADNETTHVGYNGSYLDGAYDGQIMRYDNTFGDFGVAISAELSDGEVGVSNGYAIGLKYNLALGGADLALGLGYQKAELTAAAVVGLGGGAIGDGLDATGVSVVANFDNGFTAGIEYTAFNADAPVAGIISDGDHVGVGLGYKTGAVSMHANYGKYDFDDATIADTTGYGLAVGYELGEGLSVLAGYHHNKISGAPSTSGWSLGLSMSF